MSGTIKVPSSPIAESFPIREYLHYPNQSLSDCHSDDPLHLRKSAPGAFIGVRKNPYRVTNPG